MLHYDRIFIDALGRCRQVGWTGNILTRVLYMGNGVPPLSDRTDEKQGFNGHHSPNSRHTGTGETYSRIEKFILKFRKVNTNIADDPDVQLADRTAQDAEYIARLILSTTDDIDNTMFPTFQSRRRHASGA